MYRIAIEKLLKWKENQHRKPLIIEGALTRFDEILLR